MPLKKATPTPKRREERKHMSEQRKVKQVAYLGPEGTFCEQAAKKHFPQATLIPYPSVTDIFTAVENGEVSHGVVPVENSTEGSVHATLDCLLESDVVVCGEVELRVTHNLIARPGVRLGAIRLILSHPQALAQCRRFIEKTFPSVELKETSSTARAVELLNNMDDNAAAIGTEVAAERSGMVILARSIEDEPNNFTRFFVLCKRDAEPTGKDKTSLIFSAKHVPGSLYKVLEVFAIRDINLTKIESRPEKGKPWNYLFYLDFEGHRADAKSREALDEMRERCDFVKVLGSYPKAT